MGRVQVQVLVLVLVIVWTCDVVWHRIYAIVPVGIWYGWCLAIYERAMLVLAAQNAGS